MKTYLKNGIAGACIFCIFSCSNDKFSPVLEQKIENYIELKSHSITSSYLKLSPEFASVNIYPILSSEDKLSESPEFVYGSMADGNGLMKNADGTFTLINNIEADYSIARIILDKTFKPVRGEYILNADATANTAQCSGTLINKEEHGFGPLYLSGGEWRGASKGIFITDPYKDKDAASMAQMLPALGQWPAENAVPIGKDAYPGKTVVFIGDDDADNNTPSGQLGMYVGDLGDLNGGKLYGLSVTDPTIQFEVDMKEGDSYPMEFIELNEKQLDLLDAEAKSKGVMGFSRVEDIDWRRGGAENNREIYFCVPGRKKEGLIGKGSIYGRVYKLILNPEDPSGKGTITCVLDGDLLNGKAKYFHSPDNIVVTENYAYIQEDPNRYFGNINKNHYARIYQYDLNTGDIKTVLECDQVTAAAMGIGSGGIWEITGMTDISEIIGVDETFLVITQNHGWVREGFTDPNATKFPGSNEGSILYVLNGLAR